ncbi:Membrane protein involved in the export of O-antigen and teichoic acid [Marinobacter segnicrescens]|uniref:Membrane protein involved in the export of O-antigen and teichoic acid n=1 Tax=Marinobacter segnicrescens TaxID=430453 RepID=A0A1I0GZP9_9GAMM|nr:oligosaccharide flippase family protein [Marinobacter segnicrescens]SET76924.1 Membrane protein involved in the export of O-antigen and teichoic acid [Marinobacter segnicrescens]
MSKVRRAVIFSSLGQYTMRLIGLASTMIVARLLTPAEIGTFAIASAIIMMLSEFRVLGAGAYLVRENELTDEKIRRALGLTIIIAWGIGLIVLLLGPVAAYYYDIPPLTLIFAILAGSFFLAPFLSITMALLARTFSFKTVLKAQLVGSFVNLVVTVFLIQAGFSYYSLAIGQLTQSVAQFAMIALRSEFPNFWRPAFSRLGEIASFGIYNSLTNFFRKTVTVVPDLVIGKLGTTTQVAMFSRGLGFVGFLAGTLQMGVSPVVLPYLSETRRADQDITRAYTRAVVLICALVWPVLAVAAIASLPVIRLFFGGQWDAAAPLTSVLAIWLILRATHRFANNLLVATGNERVMTAKEAFLFVAICLLVVVAFPHGLQAVANGFVVLGILEITLVTWLLAKRVGLQVGVFYRALLPNLLITVICTLTTLLISRYVDFESRDPWKPVAVIAVCLPPVWLLSLALFRHPLMAEILRMIGVGQKVVKKMS